MNLSYFSRCLSPLAPVPPLKFLMSGFNTPSFTVAIFTNRGLSIPSLSIPSITFSVSRDDILIVALFSLMLLKVAIDVFSILRFFGSFFYQEIESHADDESDAESEAESEVESDAESLPDSVSVNEEERAFKPITLPPTPQTIDSAILQKIDASTNGMTCTDIHRALAKEGWGGPKGRINSSIWRMAKNNILKQNGKQPPVWTRKSV